ncbi:Cupin 2 conserved barrel domain protein [Beutenbergia cavernae DSM 12333]|uniref:Cupin 2 conserved barrel domain protein n=1 Tax=Beutenbergia cavernae (strain ATCC BAA-8 / DSM 12333 / CCUG 43141 / JCM 11478 / NBRC 16432 / NCIMB 13614 / HKI 0122) TaxID=471853 RepID=C5BUQ4_BEUC1|nr:cupin [Beutenbergia cavernae]ACQ78278.1 Cupin 2 conserved barrel domain protein [Beutenbergia cavernae DSM 12333]
MDQERDVPRLVGDTRRAWTRPPDAVGAVWALDVPDRDLDANVIRIPPGERIEEFAGPDLDILWVVLDGEAHLTSGTTVVEMLPGAIVWLPSGSRRGVVPGPDGVRYLTVHLRKEPTVLRPTVRPVGRR